MKVGSIDAFDVASEYYQNEVFKSIHAAYAYTDLLHFISETFAYRQRFCYTSINKFEFIQHLESSFSISSRSPISQFVNKES